MIAQPNKPKSAHTGVPFNSSVTQLEYEDIFSSLNFKSGTEHGQKAV